MTTLRQLRYFEALSDTLHFGRAAERCHVSQPALSMQVAELERRLGTTLVERHPHGVSLTTAGAEIARRAKAVLRAVTDLEDYARHRGGPLVGQIRLGVIPSIGPYLLPAVLPLLKKRFPEAQLSLRETQTQHLIDELHDAKIDVALLALPVDQPGLEELALFDDTFELAVRKDHNLAARATVDQELLREERLLLLEEGHCLRDQAIAVCQNMGLSGFDEFGASSLSTIVQMVANGYGVTLLPRMAQALELHNAQGIRTLPFVDPVPRRRVGLVWRRTSPRKTDFIELGGLITEAASPGN